MALAGESAEGTVTQPDSSEAKMRNATICGDMFFSILQSVESEKRPSQSSIGLGNRLEQVPHIITDVPRLEKCAQTFRTTCAVPALALRNSTTFVAVPKVHG